MDAATQKLVDEAREEYERTVKSDGRVWYGLVGRLADALEAAQRPPEGEAFAEAFERFSMGLDYSNRDEAEAGFRAGWEAAQRPPVSPEALSAIKKEVWTEYRDRVLIPLDPDSDEWPSRYEVFYAALDALIARWSVPSQPVYDEEAVERAAKAMQLYAGFEVQMWENQNHESREWWMSQARAALAAAALRGGELTREGE